MISVSQLTKPEGWDELSRLASILHEDTRHISEKELGVLVKDKNIAIVVARADGEIIGMGTLYMIPKVGKLNAYMEDVIVDEAYRGQGLGEKIVRELVGIAKNQGVKGISLTSRTHRVAAHKLYTKLGFSIFETNVFRLKL